MRNKTREDMVGEFESSIKEMDTEWTPEKLQLREDLIAEEASEVMAELTLIRERVERGETVADRHKIRLLKELCDLQYVLSGTALQLGLPLQEAFVRVHNSNMSKFIEGKPLLREDGKVLKGPNYVPPVLDSLV